jgi:hypothetical protein
MVRLIYLLLIAIAVRGEAREAPSCAPILKYVEAKLPHQGMLKNSDGFIYVDIDDDYIHKLISFIEKDGFEEPPYFDGEGLVGAHITVIYPNDMKKYHVGEIKELGQTIRFTPKKCQVMHPPGWREMDEVYFIVVDAPELDRIRQKYGLPQKKYDYHITIGVKKKSAKAA